jgi:hypothetical protein
MNDSSMSAKNSSGWALPLLLLASLALVTAALMAWRQMSDRQSFDGPRASSLPGGASSAPAAGVQNFSLIIDYGNGKRREFDALPWSEGLTVGAALRAAKELRPGIDFTQQGEGAMALLTSLDGVANDSAVGRFWIYEVDGQAGKVSFEKQSVAAGQHVRWIYSIQDSKPASP